MLIGADAQRGVRGHRMTWRRDWRILAVVIAALLVAGVWAVTLVSKPRPPAADGRADASASRTSSVTPAVVVGDSLATVTAPAGPNIAFPKVMARLLGWRLNVQAHPDTGFTTPAGLDAQHPSFAATVRTVVAADPRVVIVALGSDDAERAGPGHVVQSTATEGLADLHRRLPGARIVVVGPLPSGSTRSPALQAVRDAVRAAAQAARVVFIDPIGEGWITGDRTDPWSGNAAQTISADGRHLTPAGHAYVGLQLATDLSRLGVASR